MDVSIIIVNYKTSHLVNDCIASLFDKVKGIDYEIIVVDNNTEDLNSAITSSGDPRVKLLQLPENVGFGRANNAGADIATGRNLFFLNPDTILINNAVKILSDYLDTHPGCGGCGGNLYNADMHPIHSFRMVLPGIFDSLDIASSRRLSRLIYGRSHEFNYRHKDMAVGYITGADLMIPAQVFREVGGFCDKIFLYYEETELCKRISDRGYKIMSVPAAEIIHLVGQSHKKKGTRKQSTVPYAYEGESRRFYLDTHCSRPAAALSRLILKLYFGSKYAVSCLIPGDINRPVKKTRFLKA